MPIWGLLVEQYTGTTDTKRWSVGVLGHVEGTRDQAMGALRERAETYQPQHPYKVKRRALYETDDGFLLVLDGRYDVYHCRFTLARQLHDTGAAKP